MCPKRLLLLNETMSRVVCGLQGLVGVKHWVTGIPAAGQGGGPGYLNRCRASTWTPSAVPARLEKGAASLCPPPAPGEQGHHS